MITQRPMQTIRSYDRLELAHLLRLSMSESMDLEASSITILAQSLRGQASLDIQIRGRSISVPQIVRRDLTQVQILLPTQTRIEDVEILASNDLLLDTISVEAQSVYQPYQQQLARPMAGEVLTLSLSQSIRVSTDLDVVALVRQQLGITLDGSSIERVAIMAHSISGRAGSAQLLINNRIVSNAKTISGVSRSIPLNVSSVETVRGDLRLVVRGDVVITRITIKVGQVRLGY